MLEFLSFFGTGLLIVVTILTLYVLSLRRIVPTNEVHIVQKTKKTVSYGKDAKDKLGNTYYQFPSWVPVLGVVVSKLPTAVFDLDLNDYDAYDQDRLPFLVDIKAFFRITDFNLAASRVIDVDELKEQLEGIVQGAIRSILAKEDLEQIMSERNKYGEMFTKEVAPQLKEWGVEAVKNIELMDIRDANGSEVIANIMKKKKSQIEMESRTTVAENLKKAQTAEIEAKQEIELKQQDAERQVGLKKAKVAQEVGIADEQSKQAVQEQAKVTTEKEMEVKKVRDVQTAEIEKQANVVKAEGEKSVVEVSTQANVIQAEADKKVKVLNAQATKEQTELKAQADLTVATKGAEGIKAEGIAKAEAEKLMQVAHVEGQIKMAEKIGENKEYQDFVIRQEQVKAMCEVGKEQARNLGNADIKIFANTGSVAEGISGATNIFNAKNGLNVASMMETLASTDAGSDLVSTLLKPEVIAGVAGATVAGSVAKGTTEKPKRKATSVFNENIEPSV